MKHTEALSSIARPHGLPLPPLLCLEIDYRVRIGGSLPRHKGPAFRGLLGQAIWSQDAGMGISPEEGDGLYRSFFKPLAPADHPDARKYRELPPPYVLRCDDQRSRYGAGERLSLRFTLIGDAAQWLEHLMPVLEEFGGHGLGREGVQLWMDTLRVIPQPETLETDRLRLDFLSPIHLKEDDGLGSPANLPLLLHRSAERLATLDHFWNQGRHPEEVLSGITWQNVPDQQAVNLRIAHTHGKHRGKRDSHIPGWIGSMDLANVEAQIGTMLQWAGRCHTGKGATWGMGAFEVEDL